MTCFNYRDYKLIIKAFKTYVRPILEYVTTVWSPTNRPIGDISAIENIQRSFRRRGSLLCKLPLLSYTDRFELFNLKRLELRRIHFNLIELLKIVNGWSTPVLRSIVSVSNITLRSIVSVSNITFKYCICFKYHF